MSDFVQGDFRTNKPALILAAIYTKNSESNTRPLVPLSTRSVEKGKGNESVGLGSGRSSIRTVFEMGAIVEDRSLPPFTETAHHQTTKGRAGQGQAHIYIPQHNDNDNRLDDQPVTSRHRHLVRRRTFAAMQCKSDALRHRL